MGKNENILDTFLIFEKAEKSIANFSNWLFGISTGLFAFVTLKVSENNFNYQSNVIYFINAMLIFTMLNMLFIGIIKYLIHKRDINLNTKIGKINKISALIKVNSYGNNNTTLQSAENEMRNIIADWYIEHNKIKTIGYCLNISIFTTLFSILNIGVYLILKFNAVF